MMSTTIQMIQFSTNFMFSMYCPTMLKAVVNASHTGSEPAGAKRRST